MSSWLRKYSFSSFYCLPKGVEQIFWTPISVFACHNWFLANPPEDLLSPIQKDWTISSARRSITIYTPHDSDFIDNSNQGAYMSSWLWKYPFSSFYCLLERVEQIFGCTPTSVFAYIVIGFLRIHYKSSFYLLFKIRAINLAERRSTWSCPAINRRDVVIISRCTSL